MQELPNIFDAQMRLLEFDVSGWPPEVAARYGEVRDAYNALREAEREAMDAQDAVTDVVKEKRDVEKYHNEHFPKQTFHDLWKQNFAGGPRNRLTRGY